MSWKQWIALFIAFGLYLLLGGVVIMIIESPAEESRLEELNELQRYVYGMSTHLPTLFSYRALCN